MQTDQPVRVISGPYLGQVGQVCDVREWVWDERVYSYPIGVRFPDGTKLYFAVDELLAIGLEVGDRVKVFKLQGPVGYVGAFVNKVGYVIGISACPYPIEVDFGDGPPCCFTREELIKE